MTKAYVVLHSTLGSAGHMAGEVVEFSKDQVEKVGIDVERLLKLGAIREATASEAKDAVQYGQSGTADIKPFPAVPYAPTNPETGEATATETTEPDKTPKK